MKSQSQETRDDLIIVARAVRTRGLKGELLADLLTDFPERFEQVSELMGVSPRGVCSPFELEKYWFQNDRIVLKFSGYDTIELAKTLLGYEFGVPEAERVQLAEDEFYDWQLEGCLVETTLGLAIGKVREVMRTGGVELLVVERDEQSEIFVPLTAAIVTEIDVSQKKILIDPPEGLLDL